MEFDELRRNWDRFGTEDPLWAVLTIAGTRGGQWDVGAFFESGRVEVGRTLERVRACSRNALGGGNRRLRRSWRRGRALDFGCGVGRVTQALAEHFGRVDGVDIAPSMIALARRYNRHGERCRFHVIDNDLAAFADATFDFVYTAHVLQHMDPRLALRTVAELLRVLRPGGLGLLQATTGRVVGASQPLPDEAFRAEIQLRGVPDRLEVSQSGIPVLCEVTNRSRQIWPAAGTDGWFHVGAGNHWLRADGELVTLDDGRKALPHDLAPAEATLVELEVAAPDRPGDYRLVVDLLQEGVAWFADKGSSPAEVAVRVVPPAGPPRTAAPGDPGPPQMEMHATPEADLVEWVARGSGQVLAVFDWDWNELAGIRYQDEWRRRGFVVSRRADRA